MWSKYTDSDIFDSPEWHLRVQLVTGITPGTLSGWNCNDMAALLGICITCASKWLPLGFVGSGRVMNPKPKSWNPHTTQSSTEQPTGAAVLESVTLGSGTPHALNKALRCTQHAPRASLVRYFGQYTLILQSRCRFKSPTYIMSIYTGFYAQNRKSTVYIVYYLYGVCV